MIMRAWSSRLVGCRLLQNLAIALTRKPLRAFEMALPATIGPKFLGSRIAVQHDPRDFLPVRAFGLRIEKAQIGDVMPFVIDG